MRIAMKVAVRRKTIDYYYSVLELDANASEKETKRYSRYKFTLN